MNNYQVTNVENEERNFIDLVKLLIKNRTFILKVTIASLVLGIVFYVIYDKTKPLNMEQKFYLTYIDRMEEMEIAGVPVAPELAFKDNKFIDMFFEKEFINELKSGKVKFTVIDISQEENEKIAEQYEVSWSSLFVNKWKGGKENLNNMTQFGFSYAKNSPKVFKEGVKKKIKELLK